MLPAAVAQGHHPTRMIHARSSRHHLHGPSDRSGPDLPTLGMPGAAIMIILLGVLGLSNVGQGLGGLLG